MSPYGGAHCLVALGGAVGVGMSAASAGPPHRGSFLGVKECIHQVFDEVQLLTVMGSVHRGAIPDLVLLPLVTDEDLLPQDLIIL